MKTKIWVLVLLCFHPLGFPLWGLETIRVITTPYPPYQFKQGDAVVGFSAEVVLQLLNRAGLTPEYQMVPWARADRLLKGEPALFFNLTRTPERETNFYWIADISPTKIFLWKKANNARLSGKSLRDLPRVTIGGMRNEVAILYLNHLALTGVSFDFGNNNEQLVQMLDAGRFDLHPLDELVFLSVVDSLGLPRQNFERFAPLPEISGRAWLVANPGVPWKMVERLKEAWADFQNDGSYERHLRGYLK